MTQPVAASWLVNRLNSIDEDATNVHGDVSTLHRLLENWHGPASPERQKAELELKQARDLFDRGRTHVHNALALMREEE